MIEDMKTEILHSLALQMDTMQLKMKREEVEKAMKVFCPRCRKKYEKNECPPDTMEVCGICYDKYPIAKCPLISSLKCILKGDNTEGKNEPLFFINQKNPPSGPTNNLKTLSLIVPLMEDSFMIPWVDPIG